MLEMDLDFKIAGMYLFNLDFAGASFASLGAMREHMLTSTVFNRYHKMYSFGTDLQGNRFLTPSSFEICELLCYYNKKLFFIVLHSMPDSEKQRFADGFKWIVERPAGGFQDIHFNAERMELFIAEARSLGVQVDGEGEPLQVMEEEPSEAVGEEGIAYSEDTDDDTVNYFTAPFTMDLPRHQLQGPLQAEPEAEEDDSFTSGMPSLVFSSPE